MTGATEGPARLVDVARAAGVSLPSVTRVLHGSAPVSDAMRERVLSAVARLNYHPNQAARALKVGQSAVISVVLTETTRHGYAATLQGVEEGARAAGYSVLIVIVEDESREAAQRAVDLSVSHNAAGVIVLEFDRAAANVLPLVPRDRPVVSVGTADPRVREAPHAYIDDRTGARDAVDHLLDLGHRTVHMVAIPERGQPSARVLGWEAALADRGAPPGRLVQASWEPESGYRAAQRLVADDPTTTAILAGNDELAFGVIRGLDDAGLDVPGRVSVVGFDDIPIARFWRPSLTTVAQDFVTLGRTSFTLLEDRVEGRTGPSAVRAAAHLVVRASTAPPPPAR